MSNILTRPMAVPWVPGMLFAADTRPGRVRQATSADLAAFGGAYVYSGAWAGRPSATTSGAGTRLFATDIGFASLGTEFRSDGTNWRVINPGVCLAKFTAPLAYSFTNSSGVLYTYTLPGGLLWANGRIRLEQDWTITSGTGSAAVTLGAALGGTNLGVTVVTPSGTSGAVGQRCIIDNQNATNAQLGNANNLADRTGLSNSTQLTAAINTSADAALTISGFCASALAGNIVSLGIFLDM